MLRMLGDAPVIPITSSEDEEEEVVVDHDMEVEEEVDEGDEECPQALHKLIITPKKKSNSIHIAQEPEPGPEPEVESESEQKKRKRDTNSVQKKKRIHHRPDSTCTDNNSPSEGRSLSSDGQSSNAENDHIGHHSGTPGTKIKDRYEIIRQIGMGTFGKVFYCNDDKHKDVVAIKVVRSIKRYVNSAKIEADILDHIYDFQVKQKSNLCLKLYSHFELDKHYFLVTEKLGPSLYDVLKMNKYKGFPMRIIRSISRQLLQAMMFLKSMNLIHTDLKVENVLFVGDLPALLSDQNNDEAHHDEGDGRSRERGRRKSSRSSSQSRNRPRELYPATTLIKIIDFGGATYNNEKKSTIINTRQYRSPEVLLETKWSFPSDLWSVGCIIAEIYKGGLLFQTHDDLEHLALIEQCCGLFPFRLLKDSSISRDYFDNKGNVKLSHLNSDSDRHVRGMPRIRDIFALDQHHQDRSGIADLMKDLLTIDPSRRVTANQALKMSFVR